MARCKDPSLTYLNTKGYNVVKLPRSGIAPLDVLGRDGSTTERLGQLHQIWKSTLPVPEMEPPRPAASINGQQTSDLKLSVGLRLLSDVLGAMGAEVPQLAFAYGRARTLKFTFTDVHSCSVAPFSLGEFLSEGDLKSANPFVSRYFEDEGTDAYVIFEVLKSNSVLVTARRDASSQLTVDVSSIQRQVGADISVTSAESDSSAIAYKGQIELTFGFKAFSIEFAEGRWQVQALAPSANTAFSADELMSDLDTHGCRVSIK